MKPLITPNILFLSRRNYYTERSVHLINIITLSFVSLMSWKGEGEEEEGEEGRDRREIRGVSVLSESRQHHGQGVTSARECRHER